MLRQQNLYVSSITGALYLLFYLKKINKIHLITQHVCLLINGGAEYI